MTNKEKISEIKFALRVLASFKTPEKIAEALKFYGITGIRGNTRNCPIKNYVYKSTGVRGIRIPMMDTLIFTGCDACINIPKSIQKFIRNFDKGSYSFLRTKKGKR